MSTLMPVGGDRLEDGCGDARAVRHVLERDLRLARSSQGDPPDQRLLQHRDLVLLDDPRAVGIERRMRRTWSRTLCRRAYSTERSWRTFAPAAESSSISSKRDPVELAGERLESGIGGEHALDVGVDLADLGAEGGRHRHRGHVGATTAERRDVEVRRQALEAGEDHHVARLERLADPPGTDVDDPRGPVLGVGDDPGLRARVRRGLASPGVHGDREQGHRDPLARREEHVELSRLGDRRDPAREPHELVGGVAHRRDDRDDVVAGLAGPHDAIGDPRDPIRVADRRSAVFLHHDGHARRVAAALRAAGRRAQTPSERFRKSIWIRSRFSVTASERVRCVAFGIRTSSCGRPASNSADESRRVCAT